MDLDAVLAQLVAERMRVDRLIQQLERLRDNEGKAARPRSRRGRKYMNPEERMEVSRRMQQYWAARKRNGSAGAERTRPSGK